MSSSMTIKAELRLHPDVQILEDEWSGVTDPILRRKLQNRLNQRAARRRKAAQPRHCPEQPNLPVAQECTSQRTCPPDLMSLLVARARTSQRCAQPISSNQPLQATFQTISQRSSYAFPFNVQLQNRIVDIQRIYDRLCAEMDNTWLSPLPGDHLISLVYYNVYRALIQNVAILGLDLSLMSRDDYPSPFLPMSPTASSSICVLPPALKPTELQCTIDHHPEHDIIPHPIIRDNILRRGEENYDDVQLCLDLIGNGNFDEGQDAADQAGFIVWGEPWDPMSWEVTEKFARKWKWLLKGAEELEISTNKWRQSRDLQPLRLLELVEYDETTDAVNTIIGSTPGAPQW